jgi:hypothetical protein
VEQTCEPSARLALKISPTQNVVLTTFVCRGYLLVAGAAAGAAATARGAGAAATGAGAGAGTAVGAGFSTGAAAGVELGEGDAFGVARAVCALADEGLVEADGLGSDCAAQPAVNTPTRRINTAMIGVVMCFIFWDTYLLGTLTGLAGAG